MIMRFAWHEYMLYFVWSFVEDWTGKWLSYFNCSNCLFEFVKPYLRSVLRIVDCDAFDRLECWIRALDLATWPRLLDWLQTNSYFCVNALIYALVDYALQYWHSNLCSIVYYQYSFLCLFLYVNFKTVINFLLPSSHSFSGVSPAQKPETASSLMNWRTSRSLSSIIGVVFQRALIASMPLMSAKTIRTSCSFAEIASGFSQTTTIWRQAFQPLDGSFKSLVCLLGWKKSTPCSFGVIRQTMRLLRDDVSFCSPANITGNSKNRKDVMDMCCGRGIQRELWMCGRTCQSMWTLHTPTLTVSYYRFLWCMKICGNEYGPNLRTMNLYVYQTAN